MLNRPNEKYIILNTWQKYIIIKNTLWHLMLNCCEIRVAVRAPLGKRGKWNRPRVLHIIDIFRSKIKIKLNLYIHYHIWIIIPSSPYNKEKNTF
jgi:hypothetical protein